MYREIANHMCAAVEGDGTTAGGAIESEDGAIGEHEGYKVRCASQQEDRTTTRVTRARAYAALRDCDIGEAYNTIVRYQSAAACPR